MPLAVILSSGLPSALRFWHLPKQSTGGRTNDPASLVRGGVVVFAALLLASCSKGPQPGEVLDEARLAGRDGGVVPACRRRTTSTTWTAASRSTPEEVKGRNMWLVWTGGNDRFWDRHDRLHLRRLRPAEDRLARIPSLRLLARQTAGTTSAWSTSPASSTPTGPDPNRFGLWLDVRRTDCPPDPFENESKYPGVRSARAASRSATARRCRSAPSTARPPASSACACSPIPDFDEKAAKAWDAERYYTDPSYYNRKDLVRPYRVGMSCGFCHVGPEPDESAGRPGQPEVREPQLDRSARSTSGSTGSSSSTPTSPRPHELHVPARPHLPAGRDGHLAGLDRQHQQPAHDERGLRPRRRAWSMAKRIGQEKLAGGELDNKQFNDFVDSGPLTEFFTKPRHGLDAARAEGRRRLGRRCSARSTASISTSACSARSGCCTSTPWSAARPITPIEIATAQKNSSYWQATEAQTPNTALFFLKAAQPDRLKDAPGGDALPDRRRGHARARQDRVRRHLRALPLEQGAAAAAGARLRPAAPARATCDCFKRYWAWTQTDDFKAQMREIVQAPDFLARQLPVDRARIPVTLLRTNACSPLATNAIARQHLGQLLVADLQEPALGRHDHGARPVHRRAAALRDAGRRPRLHARAVADQRLVDRALPAEQHRRPVRQRSLGRGAHEGRSTPRSSRCCGRRSASSDPVLGDKVARHRSTAPPSAAT